MAPKGKSKPPSAATAKATQSATTAASSANVTVPARRVPVGKVIHTWVDTMNNDVQQGYDGGRFSEAYEKLVLKPLLDGEDFNVPNSDNVEPELDSEQVKVELDEHQVEQFAAFTGMPRDDVQKLLRRHRGDLDAAMQVYLYGQNSGQSNGQKHAVAVS